MGSPARHMWHERGARRKKAWPAPKSLPLPSVRARPQKAGGHTAVEQISSNLSVLVRGLRRGRLHSCAFPACPTRRPSLPLPTHHTTDGMSAGMRAWGLGGAGAVGISALPWSAHVCSQRAIALPERMYLSGEELARDRSAPPRVLTANTDTTCIF